MIYSGTGLLDDLAASAPQALREMKPDRPVDRLIDMLRDAAEPEADGQAERVRWRARNDMESRRDRQADEAGRDRISARYDMDETMILEAARALAARLKLLLDDYGATTISLAREEALLAQGFAESVAELLAAEAARPAPATN